MEITIKLYALLDKYLPAGAERNMATMTVDAGTTPAQVIRALNLPIEHCHLVLVNGVFKTPEERETDALEPGDALAIWPPVAGG